MLKVFQLNQEQLEVIKEGLKKKNQRTNILINDLDIIDNVEIGLFLAIYQISRKQYVYIVDYGHKRKTSYWGTQEDILYAAADEASTLADPNAKKKIIDAITNFLNGKDDNSITFARIKDLIV